jgi:hypothetical protein
VNSIRVFNGNHIILAGRCGETILAVVVEETVETGAVDEDILRIDDA